MCPSFDILRKKNTEIQAYKKKDDFLSFDSVYFNIGCIKSHAPFFFLSISNGQESTYNAETFS